MSSNPLPSARANVHPADHAPSALVSKTFDVICIGSGWASRLAAATLVKAGCSALIVEEELVGGDCPYWACVPSKVLLRPDEVLQAAKSVGGAREATTIERKVDVQAVFARRDKWTGDYKDSAGIVPMMENFGVNIARGVGSLSGKKTVRITPVTGDAVEVKANLAVIIGTGSVPIYPDIAGLKEANVWTARDATSAQVVPKHLLVIGAGAVGTEMATAYASFGSKVTLVSGAAEILPSVDAEAGKVVREALQSRGVDVKVGSRVVGVHRKTPDQVMVELSNGEKITSSEVLLAAGRRGKHENLNLQSVGAKAKGNWIPVAEDLSVGTDDGETWLYAGGDVNGRALLTHTSKYHGRIMSNAIMERKQGKKLTKATYMPYTASGDIHATPQVVFSDPPVASVGLTRTSASKKGVKVREITAPFVSLGGKIASDTAVEGWAQWLVDDDNRLLGATFVGSGAADILHASTVAVVGGLTLDRLMHAIPSFPTISEVYLNLIDAAGL